MPSNAYKGQCVWCQKEFTAEISVIKKHATSEKHRVKARFGGSVKKDILTNFIGSGSTVKPEPQVKEAEIKMCGFFAEHNISFRVMDHFSALLPNIFPDSEIARKLSIKRTKTKNIITNVIAKSHKSDLVNYLKTTKFSILVDESTDISTYKTACIVVRFYCQESRKIETFLWEMVNVFSEDRNIANQGTAEHLFNLIIGTFTKYDIPLQNILGFASDGCNIMMGAYNSVASRLKIVCPGIVIYKCICHSLHICSSQACKHLPRTCEDLARNIYNFFKV